MDDNKINNPLALSPAEEANLFDDYENMERAGHTTEQGPDIPAIIEDLAVIYLTSEEVVRQVIRDRTICGPC
jgi:hypothetical protein